MSLENNKYELYGVPDQESYIYNNFFWFFKKIPRWLLVLSLLVLAYLYHFSIHGELGGVGGDNAYYIAHAKAIASAQGIESIIYTDPVTSSNLVASDSYLCGYLSLMLPFLLAPGVLKHGLNLYYMHFVIYLVSLTVPILVFYLFRRRVGDVRAFLYTALFSTTHLYLIFMVDILTENLFIALVFACFLILEKYQRSKRILSPWLFATIIACFAVIITRRPGLVMPVAVALSLLTSAPISGAWRGNLKKAAAFAGIIGALIIVWGIIIYLVILNNLQDVNKVDLDTSQMFFQSLRSAVSYLRSTSRIFLYQGHVFPGAMHETGFWILLVIALGFIVDFARHRNIMGWFFLVYAILLLFWNANRSRYLIPVAPLLFFYFFEGLLLIMKWSDRAWLRWFEKIPRKSIAQLIYIGFFILFFSYHIVGVVKWHRIVNSEPWNALGETVPLPTDQITIDWSKFRESHSWATRDDGMKELILAQEFFSLVKKTRDLTDSTDFIMSAKPRITYVLTGRKSTWLPKKIEPRTFMDLIEKHKINFIIYSQFHQEKTLIAKKAAQEYPDCFEIIWNSGIKDGKIYRVRHTCNALKESLSSQSGSEK